MIVIPKKATTLTQPWASFVMNRWKRWETRPTVSHYRGEFWIAAGLNVPPPLRHILKEDRMRELVHEAFEKAGGMPLGKLLGIVRLKQCVQAPIAMGVILADPHRTQEEKMREIYLGGYSAGRYAYELEVTRTLKEPIQVTGKQGWWFVPAEILERLTDEDFVETSS